MSRLTDRLSDEDVEAIARVIFAERHRMARERAEREAEKASQPRRKASDRQRRKAAS